MTLVIFMLLGGVAAGISLLVVYVGARTSIPPGVAGLGAIFLIVAPLVGGIVLIERRRQSVRSDRLAELLQARGWSLARKPTWSELEGVFGAAEVAAWRQQRYPGPAFIAHGESAGVAAVLMGPGGHWLFFETTSTPPTLRSCVHACSRPWRRGRCGCFRIIRFLRS